LTACAASSQALGEAMELIRQDEADLMISGGSHSMIHPYGVTGFNLLTALSTHNEDPKKASRPFDLNRNGFVIGEGAGMLILEELEHAKKRGARIYAELTGYGSTADAFRLTDSHPEGRGAIACVLGAVQDSRLPLDAVDYVNAHGTSTQVNDRVESLAIKSVFGPYAKSIPVSSSKSMLGHLIAAAGAVELITSIMTILHSVIPPTINYETPDPECDLDYVPNVAREKKVSHVLSNSFGFGGQNVSLIVSRFKD
jgi:3-oxoacyl-[acyl-carrier-protein] synthase II